MKNFLLLVFFSFSFMIIINAQSPGDIVITEFMYNANSSESTSQTQFVEIANTTSSPIDLSALEMGDAADDDWDELPSVSIPAFGVAIVCGSTAADFTGAFGALPSGVVLISIKDGPGDGIMFNLSNSPSGSNESVAIRVASTMAIIDEVFYDDSGIWPGDPGGLSIVLNLDEATIISSGAVDNDNGSNWVQASSGVAGAFTSTASGVWNNSEISSPGLVGTNAVSVLPIELSFFVTEKKGEVVNLLWQTSSELNNSHFEIQHSTDNRTFTTIGKQEGAGNSDVNIDYNFTHETPANGVNYYRLQQFDFDGQSEYSQVISVRFGKDAGISIYPNPVQSEVTVALGEEFATNSTAQIISQNGSIVLAETFTAKSFTQTMNVNSLPTGVYVLRVVNGNDVYTERFVKK